MHGHTGIDAGLAVLTQSKPPAYAKDLAFMAEITTTLSTLASAAAKAREALAIPPGSYRKVKLQLRGDIADRCHRIVADDNRSYLGCWGTN